MSYEVLVLRRAARQLANLPPDVYTAVRDRIRELSAAALPPESEKIAGREGWRVPAGRYRVIYKVDSAAARVTVLDVSPRSDA